MNRIYAGYITGAGLVALGLFFGFAPCFYQPHGTCFFILTGTSVSVIGLGLLVWGLMILGIGVLAVSLFTRFRTMSPKEAVA